MENSCCARDINYFEAARHGQQARFFSFLGGGRVWTHSSLTLCKSSCHMPDFSRGGLGTQRPHSIQTLMPHAPTSLQTSYKKISFVVNLPERQEHRLGSGELSAVHELTLECLVYVGLVSKP